MPHIALTIIFDILLFPAIFLVLIPMLPAMSYMFGMALIYGIIDGFAHLQGWELLALAGIFCLSLIVDYSAGVLGAKYVGASRKAVLYGFVGLVVGSVLFPPFGGIAGLFLLVFLSELFSGKSRAVAWKAAAGSFIGAVSGVILIMESGMPRLCRQKVTW